jgi:hypothetical protein
MSETEYVAQQAADAKAAMARTVRGIARPLENGAHEHPLLVIGAAALAGALAARAIRPSSHNGASEKKPSRPSFLVGVLADAIKPLALDMAVAGIAAISKLFIKPPQDAPTSRIPPE